MAIVLSWLILQVELPIPMAVAHGMHLVDTRHQQLPSRMGVVTTTAPTMVSRVLTQDMANSHRPDMLTHMPRLMDQVEVRIFTNCVCKRLNSMCRDCKAKSVA